LLRVAESLLAPELAPRALPAMAPSDPTVPYTGDEETILTDWAKAEKRKGHGSDALVLLALGFGAGLSATEIMTVRAGDVAVRDEAVVVIVREGRVREVTVLRKWERALAKRAGELEPEEFLFKPGRAGGSKNLISNFVTRANVQGVHAQTQRMRSTWLVLHMGAGTSLVDLVDAAGVDSLEALTRYLQFVRRVPSAEAAKQLRSAA
jgi:integrase